MSSSDAIFRFISRIQRLEALPRTGWLVSGVVQPESVAAHAYEVAMIALWLADELDEAVDVERVLRIALLHDVGEALTSDVPLPVKRLLGRDDFRRAETRAVATVVADAPSDWTLPVAEYDAAETLEARIVKGADRIQMLARALAYEAAGRGDLRRFWKRPQPDYGIALVGTIIDRLFEMRDRGAWYPADFD